MSGSELPGETGYRQVWPISLGYDPGCVGGRHYTEAMTETAGTDVMTSEEVDGVDEASAPLPRDVVGEAVALIDRGLADIQSRELLSSNEVADLLLDVRLLLSIPHVDISEALEGNGSSVLANAN